MGNVAGRGCRGLLLRRRRRLRGVAPRRLGGVPLRRLRRVPRRGRGGPRGRRFFPGLPGGSRCRIRRNLEEFRVVLALALTGVGGGRRWFRRGNRRLGRLLFPGWGWRRGGSRPRGWRPLVRGGWRSLVRGGWRSLVRGGWRSLVRGGCLRGPGLAGSRVFGCPEELGIALAAGGGCRIVLAWGRGGRRCRRRTAGAQDAIQPPFQGGVRRDLGGDHRQFSRQLQNRENALGGPCLGLPEPLCHLGIGGQGGGEKVYLDRLAFRSPGPIAGNGALGCGRQGRVSFEEFVSMHAETVLAPLGNSAGSRGHEKADG